MHFGGFLSGVIIGIFIKLAEVKENQIIDKGSDYVLRVSGIN